MSEDKEKGTVIEADKAATSADESSLTASDVASVVDWDGPDDPNNPMNWPSSRKWITIGLISFNTFNAYGTKPNPVEFVVLTPIQRDGINPLRTKCIASNCRVQHQEFRALVTSGLCVYHWICCRPTCSRAIE